MWISPTFVEFDLEELTARGSLSIACDRYACGC